MNKLQTILMFLMPAVQGAARYLRMRDTNSEGRDDQAADALDFAVGCVEALAYGTPLPDLPKSLRPKIDESEETEMIKSSSDLGKE